MIPPEPHHLTSTSLTYNASIFSFFKINEPRTMATGKVDLLCVLHCKIRSWCISLGLPIDHEWSESKFLGCVTTLIRASFLEVCLAVGLGADPSPSFPTVCLKLVWPMLQTWNLVCKYKHKVLFLCFTR